MTALLAGLMALNAFAIDAMVPALPAIGRSLGVAHENDRQLVIVAYFVGFTVTEVLGFSVMLLLGRRERPSLGSVIRTQWGRLLVFGVLSPLSYILVLTATKIAPIALIAPMREVSVILVSLYSVWRFKQDRAVLRIGAAGVVVAGIALIGLS